MLERTPSPQELEDLLGEPAYSTWREMVEFIHSRYDMEAQWDSGRKAGVYEYKFRKSGKTLCALYARDNSFGFMVIFGKAERERFESERHRFSEHIQAVYEQTTTYHDGKWLMVDIADERYLPELKEMLAIKKRPKKTDGVA